MTTVVCAASGPSLTPEQCALIMAAQAAGKCHVLAVNNSWEALPTADAMYAADQRWWKHYGPKVLAEFGGECWTCNQDVAREMGLCFIKVVNEPGLSLDPARVNSGFNGGYQLIGLAHVIGLMFPEYRADRILLAGYDMKRAANGRAHHHADHPLPMNNASGVDQWVKNFDRLAWDLHDAGVECINCSIETALTCFKRADLAEALR